MQGFKEKEFDEKIDFSIWRRLLKFARPYRRDLIAIIIAMAITAAADIALPLLTKYAIDTYIAGNSLQGLPGFMAVYAVIFGIQGALVAFFVRKASKVEMYVSYDIRKEGFKRLQQLSFSFYDHTPVGYMMARMTSDVNRLSETIGWSLTDVAWSICFVLGVAGAMLAMNWRLALLVLVVLPPLAVVSLYFQKKILHYHRIIRRTNSRITGAFNEGITGAKTSKTLVREQANLEEFQVLTKEMYRSSVKSATFSAIYMPIVMVLGSIGTALALWQGGNIALLTGFGTLAAFLSYTTQFFDPVQQLARIFAELQSAQAAAERVMNLVETAPEITDSQGVEAIYGDVFAPKRENWEKIEGRVTFKHTGFAYQSGERVLEDFNLDVRPGERIALVGETGAGKSTIVNLLCRFYEPTEGQILIDGKDYRARSQLWLQSNLGYVLQSPHLFSGTIADNIRYGNRSASLEQVRRAARLVHADGFIEALEKGYDTQVGEGGNLLSTGQKQLISFARAILPDPQLFVLDEATSSIDTETEALIQQAIYTVLENRTSFIVAHRLSTIRSADRILVIGGGKIIEQGSHRELMAQRGHYYELYTRQFMQERQDDLLAGMEKVE